MYTTLVNITQIANLGLVRREEGRQEGPSRPADQVNQGCTPPTNTHLQGADYEHQEQQTERATLAEAEGD